MLPSHPSSFTPFGNKFSNDTKSSELWLSNSHKERVNVHSRQGVTDKTWSNRSITQWTRHTEHQPHDRPPPQIITARFQLDLLGRWWLNSEELLHNLSKSHRIKVRNHWTSLKTSSLHSEIKCETSGPAAVGQHSRSQSNTARNPLWKTSRFVRVFHYICRSYCFHMDGNRVSLSRY